MAVGLVGTWAAGSCTATSSKDALPGTGGDSGSAGEDGTSGSSGEAAVGGASTGGNGGDAGAGAVGGAGGAGAAASGGGGGSTSGSGGSGGEIEPRCVPDQPACVDNIATQCNPDGTGYVAGGTQCSTSQTCVAGVCANHECVPEASFCSSGSVRRCTPNGLSSDVVEDCAANEYCDDASATCRTGVCAPDAPACDNNRATVCNEDGSGFNAGGTNCPSDTTCQAGACEDHVCTPDAPFCQGQDVKRCSTNGLSSSVEDTCVDQTCVESGTTATCSGSCAPGQQRCNSNRVQNCNASGSFANAPGNCTTSNQTCVESGDTAACSGFCVAGEKDCFNGSARTCNQDGSGYASEVSCPELCSAGECQSFASLVGALDGRLQQTPCSDTPSTDDCNVVGHVDGVTTSCSGGRLTLSNDYPIGGVAGTTYQLTLHFYGVVEPKNYGSGVSREADPDRPDQNGGTPTPWASAPAGHAPTASNYNTYEIRVLDEADVETAAYYLNADTQEGHYTILLNYEKTIPVVGGGTVRVRHYNANCRQIKNCGAGGTPCAAKARTVNVSAASPAPPGPGAPPSGFSQPGLGQALEHSGQWLLIDVVDVQ